jgi:hypothetical protein
MTPGSTFTVARGALAPSRFFAGAAFVAGFLRVFVERFGIFSSGSSW